MCSVSSSDRSSGLSETSHSSEKLPEGEISRIYMNELKELKEPEGKEGERRKDG